MATTAHDTKIVDQFTRWAKPFADLPVHSDVDGMARTLAAAGIEPDMEVLDVACGPGIVTCAAAPHARHVTGIDLTPAMIEQARERQRNAGLINVGDLVVITAGVPVGRTGTTNLIKGHHVGEMIAKGQGIGTLNATGKVVTARTAEEANAKATQGCILVTVTTDKEYMPAFEKAAAVITEVGGITSHAAVVGLSLGIPVIVGVEGALDKLSAGTDASVYAELGVIYSGKANVL